LIDIDGRLLPAGDGIKISKEADKMPDYYIEHIGQFSLRQVRHIKNIISPRPMRSSSQYPKNNTLLCHSQGIGKPKRAIRDKAVQK
jgi:hypothetical protein